MRMFLQLYFTLLCICQLSWEQCTKSPAWVFSLPDDLRPIYDGLSGPFLIIVNGNVTSLLANPELAPLIALSDSISEFPLVWCNAGSEEARYILTLESSNTGALGNPLVSVPYEGLLPTNPYRFRACFPCLSEEQTLTSVNVTLRVIRESDDVEYCPSSFYFSKICNRNSIKIENCTNENGTLGIEDGFVNVTELTKTAQNGTTITPVPPPMVPVATIVVSTIIPVGLVLLVTLALFIVWLSWYRRRRKIIASFQPEAVSMAYQRVYPSRTQRMEAHEKEFPVDNLSLMRELGEGAFGVVYEAKAVGIEGEGTTSVVAVKQLRGESTPQTVQEFFREVDFMSRLEHPRIVRLLGVCSQKEPFAMIFEYMDLGDLRGFLRDAAGLGEEDDEEGKLGTIQDNPLLSTQEQLSIALQVAEGMVYIASKHLIHRDLATRNCLVATGLVVKIADFGMSRDIYSSDYYRVHGSAMLPVRWMPPESLLYGKFSTQSDIWAFGVLLWEIFTFGQQPYTGLTNEEVIKCVKNGVWPQIPPNCPASNLIKSCWKRSPKARLNFGAICGSLKTISSTLQ